MTNATKALIVFLLIIGVLLIYFLPVQAWALVAHDWVLENPRGSVAAFLALFLVWVVMALPASVLVVIAGYLFGLAQGFGLVVLGSILGSTVAFVIARHGGRNILERRLGSHPKFIAIDKAIQDSGLSVVFLTRLSMILPYNLLNYAFGLTSVSLKDYVLATTVGMLLPQLLFTFLGTTAKDLTAVLQGEVQFEGYTWVLGLGGLLALALAVVIITTKAKRALEEVMEK